MTMSAFCTLVTQQAPDLRADAVMPVAVVGQITLSALKGKYVSSFFLPA